MAEVDQKKPVMVVGIDDSEQSFYALEWALDHFFPPGVTNYAFELVLVHAKPAPSFAIGMAGPGGVDVLPYVESDLKKIAARVVEKAKELCIAKSEQGFVCHQFEGFLINMDRSNSIMRYFTAKRKQPESSGQNVEDDNGGIRPSEPEAILQDEFDFSSLPMDPGLRKMISEYPSDLREQIRKYYIAKGPVQPRDHEFPYKLICQKMRRFNPKWFDDYGTWLEYSKKKDAAFCLCCYLFANVRENSCGDFIKEGFSTWNKTDRFKGHIGDVNSIHNKALRDYENLRRPAQSIRVALDRHDEETRRQYRLRLDTSVSCSRYLLRQGLAFRGHDESEESENRGNFIELVKFAASLNQYIASVVLDKAPKKEKLISPLVQKDIVNSGAEETLNGIMEEFKGDVFGLLVDESRDVANKEQMSVVVRYVDKMGIVKERFIGLEHVVNTSASSLKVAIEKVFAKHNLSLSSLRSQGYDGASNMQGKFNGLKTLILNENKSAFSIHCFSHQLQLTLVALARDNNYVGKLFDEITKIVNMVGASCKRHDLLRQKQAEIVKEALSNDELETGRGLNQELAPVRAGETRWSSHHKQLHNVSRMYDAIVGVLEHIEKEGETSTIRNEATMQIAYLTSFDFAFTLQMMLNILGITHDLSQALQKKDQNIINAMKLVEVTKNSLDAMRKDGWETLLEKTCAFCEKYYVSVPNMQDVRVLPGRPRRNVEKHTYEFHYRVEVLNTVLDLHLGELNRRFDETNTELLLCVACLSPCDGFRTFDQAKLIKLAHFYPYDFTDFELTVLEHQLCNYLRDVLDDEDFQGLKQLGDLCRVMVETKKHITYPLVFRLLKLALILPVSTATVERAFSAMKIVKSRLRNKMCDSFLNDCLVCYIEKDVFDSITNESIMRRYQNMKARIGQL